MNHSTDRISELARLIAKNSPEEGPNQTPVPLLSTWKITEPYRKTPQVYEPCMIIGAQGRKNIYLGKKRYDYYPGSFLTLFAPMPLECELLEASPKKPLLAAMIRLDRKRCSRMIFKMEQTDPRQHSSEPKGNVSGIFSASINPKLLDVVTRLFNTLDAPNEAAIIGESAIDEIYFRILSDEQGGMLKVHLQQRGQIHEISKAVEYVHENLEKKASIDDLADIVNMSSSGFHKKFKEVMQLSPLQYVKSIKLNKAQTYIMEGKSVSEAGFMVGYNSPAQFSREYKRFFGVAPSATLR